jgi:hypothetical protein
MVESTRCAVCCRTPLVGEEITVMGRGRPESVVCDLCLERPRAAALGKTIHRERVRSTAGAANVHRARPAPAPELARQVAAR